jgi:hypothetical protein
MTPEQRDAVATTKRLAEKLGRRPTGKELQRAGVHLGPKKVFLTLNAVLVAADLAEPASRRYAGFTAAEDKKLRRLWEEGVPVEEIAEALGVIEQVLANETAARRLTRPRRVIHTKKGQREPVVLTRRCLEPQCGRITQGAGPCQHCGAKGLTSAA